MKVLSIQSAVAYGHVGNSAAVFLMQRIGVEVLPVYTVNFSNHTGYGAWRGPMISPEDVREVITQSLSLQPQPAYHEDTAREYATEIGGWRVRWVMAESGVCVRSCEKVD